MGLKAFNDESVDVLLSSVSQVKKSADANTSATSDLSNDFRELTEHVTDALTGIGKELETKQEKVTRASCTVPITGWSSDSTADYPNYCDISASGVTADDYIAFIIKPDDLKVAIACGFCPVCESLAGKIRVRSAVVPAKEMNATYYIV